MFSLDKTLKLFYKLILRYLKEYKKDRDKSRYIDNSKEATLTTFNN